MIENDWSALKYAATGQFIFSGVVKLWTLSFSTLVPFAIFLTLFFSFLPTGGPTKASKRIFSQSKKVSQCCWFSGEIFLAAESPWRMGIEMVVSHDQVNTFKPVFVEPLNDWVIFFSKCDLIFSCCSPYVQYFIWNWSNTINILVCIVDTDGLVL